MPETATDSTDSRDAVPGFTGQTFLVGETIYLRPVEETDAQYGMSWRDTIFPKSPSRIEKWITEEMKEERRVNYYIILRKADDRPVGSVKTERHQQSVWLMPHVDRLFGEQGDRWLVEALGLVLPWIIDEQHRAIAHLEDIPSDRTILLEGLHAIGARESGRFREAVKREDRFIDAISFEYLNRQWIETLGDPKDVALERSGTGEPRPVSPPVAVEGDLPRNAMRIGERVYLRPLQKRDARLISQWSRRENDTNWDNGRSVYTTVSVQKWFESLQKDEPQDWVRFAVCLRETGETIGAVGIDGVDYQNRRAESESEIFRPEYRGGGYGSEAKHLLFDYAFNTLGLHSLQSWVFFPNLRSAAALRKQGYREAGREHWLLQGEGGYKDFGTYDLLAAEWRAMPRREMGQG
ncbi:MAG TPA: GNAT family N-acetyltransferase [Thermomicrobiales bacterium]|nr:GNAT family N-acetyltransferase [Thermomicrobiales bacterium]